MTLPVPAHVARVTLVMLVICAISAIGTSCSARLHQHRAGDGGLATRAEIDEPSGVEVIVADYDRNRVRRIDGRTREITLLGGNGKPKRAIILL